MMARIVHPGSGAFHREKILDFPLHGWTRHVVVGPPVGGEGRRTLKLDDGFTRVSVSAAVATTGCIHAPHMRCGRGLVDGELLIFAKLWAAPGRPAAKEVRRPRPKMRRADRRDFPPFFHALGHFL